MGSFFTNLQVRSADRDTIAEVLRMQAAGTPAWVAPAHRGWTSVHPLQTENQDVRVMADLVMGVSKTLGCHVLGLMVHDDTVLLYWLGEDGVIVDHYNSWPAYFGQEEDAAAAARGRPDVLARAAPPETDADDLAHVLGGGARILRLTGPPGGERTTEAGEGRDPWRMSRDLARLMGYHPARAMLGFRHVEAGNTTEDTRTWLRVEAARPVDDDAS